MKMIGDDLIKSDIYLIYDQGKGHVEKAGAVT